MDPRQNTHSVAVGYLVWIFGFIGAHRFYYGKPFSGTLWFFTLGLLYDLWTLNGQVSEINQKEGSAAN